MSRIRLNYYEHWNYFEQLNFSISFPPYERNYDQTRINFVFAMCKQLDLANPYNFGHTTQTVFYVCGNDIMAHLKMYYPHLWLWINDQMRYLPLQELDLE